MSKSRLQREKAKHRTGLLKRLTMINEPRKKMERIEQSDNEMRRIAKKLGLSYD